MDLERLGKYEIRGVLGKGAMGVVYLGYDPHIDRPVAIKTINKATLDPELAAEFMTRFKNEARAAGRLTHANIVAVYEYGNEGGVAYIVMEYVDGTGLREYLNRRATFDFAQLVALMTQLLDALEFAHRCGVIHRDIKPSNLIVTGEGTLKVADFGVARIDMSSLTLTGMVVGTPSYMSPEQCSGRMLDARSDIFSAGVVLYELMTGQRPFVGSIETITHKICHEEAPPPSQLSGQRFPREVDQLVAKAMAKRPEERFPSARAFRDALLAVREMEVPADAGDATTLVNIGTLVLRKPASLWDDETLNTVEHELAQFLGPMARVLVRRAAARTSDRGELCALLAESVDDPDTRRRLVDACARAGGGAQARTEPGARDSGARSTDSRPAGFGAAGPVQSTRTVSGVPLDAAYIDQVSARLTVYMGPIARVVTKRAAQRAKSRGEFVRIAAENLGTQDRAAFLRELGYAEK
jgi:eukaryotic-like serine/threonine-protein kinase